VPSSVTSRAANTRSNSGPDSSPVSRRCTGLPAAASRPSHSRIVTAKLSGVIRSAVSHSGVDTRNGVVSTPP
jgi:hypothetical protein